MLLEHNADPNQARLDDGITAVWIAAEKGHADAVKLLLEHNADPNQARPDDGITAVWIAAENGHFDVVKMLLEHNADPNQARPDNGITPVWIAAQGGRVLCLKLLLEHNADPNQARTDNGVTPLHVSALKGQLDSAQLLVVHSADIAAAGFSGNAPPFYAIQDGHQLLADWLNAVATWSSMRVAAALRMHGCITYLLQQGRLDPDDRVKFPAAEMLAAIAASTAMPAELPWVNALPTCRTTIELVRGATFGWKYSTHRLYHASSLCGACG